jgi:2,5-diketo-D-gluconate reductase A
MHDDEPVMADSTVQLRSGVRMPVLGLGGGIFSEAEASFTSALSLGYRLFDTAPKYGESEAALGRAIQLSGVPRAELFLASKVGNGPRAELLKSFKSTLAKLQTTYLDLLLLHSAIHQPTASQPRSQLHATSRAATWKAIVALRAAGLVRSIGVCNHSPRQLAMLQPLPDVVQIEFHPFLQRRDVLAFCRERSIAVQAYGTGGGGWKLWRKDSTLDMLSTEPILTAAAARRWSAHTTVLRWTLDQGVCVIPKAAQREHQKQNREEPFRRDAAPLSQAEDAAISRLCACQRSLYRFRDPDEYA